LNPNFFGRAKQKGEQPVNYLKHAGRLLLGDQFHMKIPFSGIDMGTSIEEKQEQLLYSLLGCSMLQHSLEGVVGFQIQQ
jgi:hypothetical protein